MSARIWGLSPPYRTGGMWHSYKIIALVSETEMFVLTIPLFYFCALNESHNLASPSFCLCNITQNEVKKIEKILERQGAIQVFIFVILGINNIHRKFSFDYSFQRNESTYFLLFLLYSIVILKWEKENLWLFLISQLFFLPAFPVCLC